MSANVITTKHLRARYAGTCTGCGRRFPVGTEITWVRAGEGKAETLHDACFNARQGESAQQELPKVPRPVRDWDGNVLEWATAARTWTGEKQAQWILWSICHEHWDGEPELVDSYAHGFHNEWEARTWRRLYETARGDIEREGGWR